MAPLPRVTVATPAAASQPSAASKASATAHRGTITEESAAGVIPEKDTTVLVYCRSGNRSKTASKALAELGYTNIYEFGGISTWPYDIEKD